MVNQQADHLNTPPDTPTEAPPQSPPEETASNRPGDSRVSAVVRTVLSILVASPFLVAGAGLLLASEQPPWAALAVLLVGVVITLAGIYLTLVGTWPRLDLLPDEETMALRHPSMKPAYTRIAMSLPFFAVAGYLLEFTSLPYVYPFVPFLVAMYLYFRGIFRYWVNHHTSYFVTNRRVVHMYRFAWLTTTEIPVRSINSISESRSFIEMISRRGSVVVASGIGARHKVRIQEIDSPGPLARAIRQLVQ